jgi:tetratricopeptide (TPR) repeat protein
MKIQQIADSSIAAAQSTLPGNRVHDQAQREYRFGKITQAGGEHSYQLAGKATRRAFQVFRSYMKVCLSFCLCCVGTVAAMGSGSGGGGGGSSESESLKKEVGSSAFKVYNQGVDLMHAKKFAAAQLKFEQAIRVNPNFAEAHNNLGFTLRQQGPQNYPKALEHYSKAIQLKPNMAETYEYRGVLFAKMGRKADSEKDLVTLKKLNPKLAGELEEYLKTGKEEDEYDATSPKEKS